MNPAQSARVLRFGVFEVDLQTGELHKAGLRVKLQEQPFRILAMLLEHPGEVVARDELRQRLWPADTFVDFDHSLNSAVKKLRQALGDDSDNPRFVETLPRRGYRLIVPVNEHAERLSSTEPSAVPSEPLHTPLLKSRYYRLALVGGFVVIAVSFPLLKLTPAHPAPPKVLGFVQITNDSQIKLGSLGTDASRIYTTELLPGPQTVIVQVSAKGGETVPLPTSLKQPREVDLSPDGGELLVVNDDAPSSLWIQPVAGGSPRRVGTVVVNDRVNDASWCADGETIIYSNGNDIYRVKKDGTLSRKLLTVPGSASDLRFSPDGRALRFTVYDDADGSTSIWEASADGSDPHPLLPEWNKPASESGGIWTRDGRYFIFESTHDGRADVWAIREKSSFLGRVDRPVQLTAGPMSFSDPIPSKDGKELFAVGVLRRAEVVRYNLSTGEFVPYLSGISAEGLAFSRDGEWVTYTSYPEGALWRSKVDGSKKLQLTFPPTRAFLPRWSPDGKQIAFVGSSPGRPWKIYLVSAEGGTPQQLLPGDQNEGDATWSPDGSAIAFGRLPWGLKSSPETVDIQVVDLKTLQTSKLPGSDGLFSPRWSPDGRYLVALTLASTFDKTPNFPMLFDFTSQKWEYLVHADVSYPNWSQDGKYLYLQNWSTVHQDGRVRIVRLRLSDREMEKVVEFKDLGRVAVGTATWSGVAPDGSPLLARDVGTQEIYALKWQAP
jgi:Tol biopolymer transport system component/DNA-binding winged helix-turn-helix (wHTH) protein